jgi:hypothetical protein
VKTDASQLCCAAKRISWIWCKRAEHVFMNSAGQLFCDKDRPKQIRGHADGRHAFWLLWISTGAAITDVIALWRQILTTAGAAFLETLNLVITTGRRPFKQPDTIGSSKPKFRTAGSFAPALNVPPAAKATAEQPGRRQWW